MTHRIDEMNVLDAAFMAAREYPGGIEALAARLGTYSRVLRKKLATSGETRNLTLDEFSELIDRCEEARGRSALLPMRALAWRHGGVFIRLPEPERVDSDAFLAEIIHTAREQGDVIREIEWALADDGKLDARELARVERKIHEAISAQLALLEAAKARSERDRA